MSDDTISSRGVDEAAGRRAAVTGARGECEHELRTLKKKRQNTPIQRSRTLTVMGRRFKILHPSLISGGRYHGRGVNGATILPYAPV